jgi:tetratricopeptide (TPR) repeat protein
MLNSYYYIYYSLVNAYRNLSKTQEATAAVDQMYQHAKEHDNNIGMGTALFVMGRIYNDQKRYADQEQCLREAIDVLRDSALNKLVDVYLHLGDCLVSQERYQEAVSVAADMEPVIKRYEEAGSAPMPVAWLNQSIVYISAYIQLKEYDKAEVYCNKVENLSNGTIIPYEARAAIFASRKQYAKALEMADKAIETTYPSHKLTTMKVKMGIWLEKEGDKTIQNLFKEIIDLQTSEYNEESNAKLDELRTLYEVDKITAQNDRIQIEKNRN